VPPSLEKQDLPLQALEEAPSRMRAAPCQLPGIILRFYQGVEIREVLNPKQDSHVVPRSLESSSLSQLPITVSTSPRFSISYGIHPAPSILTPGSTTEQSPIKQISAHHPCSNPLSSREPTETETCVHSFQKPIF
jgi:hypothetical protein